MIVLCASTVSMQAQKFALVDMDYIFKNIPAYERANEQLNQVSKKWQAEVEALQVEAQTLYKNYQNEVVFSLRSRRKPVRTPSSPRNRRPPNSRRSTSVLRVSSSRSAPPS